MTRGILHRGTCVLGLCALAHAAAVAAELSFTEVILDERPLASDRANDVAVADIDGDGRLDVWLSGRNGRGHQSAWYRNPGEKGEWRRFPFAEGSWKYGDLGDLDGDGDIDLVAGYDLEKKVYWAENTGTPTNAPWPKHFLGITGAPDQLLARDLDGDGKSEIVALYKNGPIHILRPPEDAKQVWKRTTIDSVPRGTAGGSIGDVDNDGDLDIVFGNAWYENPGPARDPGFGANWIIRIVDKDWPRESRSAVADIDGDGRSDLLFCAEESDEGAVWYRRAKAKPIPEKWIPTKINRERYDKLHSCQVADFNLDGRPDVMVAEMHTADDRRVAVFLQGGDPSRWTETIVATTGSHNAKVADIDGNGVPDIVGKNYEDDMRPRIWFGSVANAKPPPEETSPLDKWRTHILKRELPYQATFIRTGDLNGDGRPDIAAGGWWWENPGPIGADWTQHKFGGGLRNVALLHDFDGDGMQDVLGTNGAVRGGQFYLALNVGGGKFDLKQVGPVSRGDFLQGAVVGRFDEHGMQVVLSWHNGDRVRPKIGTERLRVPDKAAGVWKLERLSELTNEEEIAIGDLDGNGHLDIHLGTHWLRNLLDEGFETRRGVEIADGAVDRLRLADIDGDGDLDVVIGMEDAESLIWGENRESDGIITWTAHRIAADFLHMSVDVGDIDGDGDVDVVSGAHKKRGEVMVYENLGKGARWRRHAVSNGGRGIDHHVGTQLIDLDGDGDLDVISVGWRYTSVVIYENRAIDRTPD